MNKERAPWPQCYYDELDAGRRKEMLDGAVENGEGNPEENAVRQKLWALRYGQPKKNMPPADGYARAVDYHEPVAQGYGLPLPCACGGEGAGRHAQAAWHRCPAGKRPGAGAGLSGAGACRTPVSFHLCRGQL